MISRIPITDISPVVYFGGEFVPVKAIVNEEILVSATVAGEGHDYPDVYVITRDGNGKELTRTKAIERSPGTDRYEALIALPKLGNFTFEIEAAIITQYRTVKTNSPQFPVYVERERALVGAWYEFFPRSEGAIENKDGSITSGTFKTASARIPVVAAMGFDILYLPPIHPIGVTHRKGRNNTLTPTPSDPGVPWAIGGAEGGHMAINPALGTMKDFEDFVAVYILLIRQAMTLPAAAQHRVIAIAPPLSDMPERFPPPHPNRDGLKRLLRRRRNQIRAFQRCRHSRGPFA